ncbi:cysteine desulfurase-like protein [Micromonospora echinospora]|uniref:Cysteine desulfurase family protein, VC1184 subfamily n=1 Tax=Micromonospora echinospora TaxID=1877 RepID=A0A1C5A8P1_MICEC|nr:cysteine desulfurase-like protein [Micromonospora echinospora]OZV78804.1 cysteine desulfurase-like protein [Micromonospora echinospora]SCF41557.1 cysteine desulfurase family protein, VC1184 subfamily [Micromonospora echinospora]
MSFDVTRVRAAYPALAEGHLHFDGAAGTQPAAGVVEAVTGAMRHAVDNRSAAFAPGRRSLEFVAAARTAVADLLGVAPDGVVLGPSATALTYTLARTLGDTWRPGDEVVVSRLDHDANVRPWVRAAERAGATVRWAEFDPATGELPTGQYADLVGERTRLVAVTAASNAVGTVPDVAAIARLAHAAGALVCVDGVHAVPHGPTDVPALGADFFVTSAYKWSGPHLAALVADPARWAALRPDKLRPSSDAVPDRFEYGTPSFPLLAGLTAAVEHLAGLNPTGRGDRRSRVRAGLAAARAHEQVVFDRLLAGLAALPGVTVLPAPAGRCPTVSFRLAGSSPAETATALGEAGICLSHGDYYAYEYFQALGLRERGGAVRASVYHYNTVEEVDRLLAELDRLASGGWRMTG